MKGSARLVILLVGSVWLHAVGGTAIWGMGWIFRVLDRAIPTAKVADPHSIAALAGETFELPAPPTEEVPLANASPTVEQRTEAPGEAPGETAKATRAAKGDRSTKHSHVARPSGGRPVGGDADTKEGSAVGPSLYGAVGDRSAVDVATAFTRAFPQAASGDPVWRGVPIGAAGEASVTITIDEEGHIVDAQVGGAPSAAFAGGIRRTLALIKGRTFVSKARVTRLALVATVSTDSVHDGLHGEVFAIGGSYTGGEGNAFFALAIGRRIDVRVRAR